MPELRVEYASRVDVQTPPLMAFLVKDRVAFVAVGVCQTIGISFYPLPIIKLHLSLLQNCSFNRLQSKHDDSCKNEEAKGAPEACKGSVSWPSVQAATSQLSATSTRLSTHEPH